MISTRPTTRILFATEYEGFPTGRNFSLIAAEFEIDTARLGGYFGCQRCFRIVNGWNVLLPQRDLFPRIGSVHFAGNLAHRGDFHDLASRRRFEGEFAVQDLAAVTPGLPGGISEDDVALGNSRPVKSHGSLNGMLLRRRRTAADKQEYGREQHPDWNSWFHEIGYPSSEEKTIRY